VWKHLRKSWVTRKVEKQLTCNIKMDLREIGFKDMTWKEQAKDRVHWRALSLAV
jgi:hypothetical protein